VTTEQLLRKVEDHLDELRDAFARGALSSSDGKNGTRSNRNMDVLVEVWQARRELAKQEKA